MHESICTTKNHSQLKFRKEPDDFFKVIGNNSLPIRSHGGRAFDRHDQLLLRHVPVSGSCPIWRQPPNAKPPRLNAIPEWAFSSALTRNFLHSLLNAWPKNPSWEKSHDNLPNFHNARSNILVLWSWGTLLAAFIRFGPTRLWRLRFMWCEPTGCKINGFIYFLFCWWVKYWIVLFNAVIVILQRIKWNSLVRIALRDKSIILKFPILVTTIMLFIFCDLNFF